MSKLKTPPDKKQAAYDRDHRTPMEAPHAFRKNWPKKKARINRTRRRVGDRALQAVLRGADVDGVLIPKRVRGEHLHKMGVAPLGQFVAHRRDRRCTEFLPRYMGRHYDPQKHGAPFSRFLAALVRGRSELAGQRAAYLSWLLDALLPNNSPVRYKRAWFMQFFHHQPQWEPRLRTWIEHMQGGTHQVRRRTTG